MAAVKVKNPSTIFSAGVPTAPDVQVLLDAYGVPAEGTLIPYEDAAKRLGLNIKSCRFRTVTGAWRRRLEKEHGCLLVSQPTVGWEAADPKTRLGVSHGLYRAGLRRAARCSTIAERTDRARLVEDERRALDHYRRIGGVMRLAAATEAKTLPSGE